MNAQEFGEVLRRLREQAGLSQDQLAERSGLSAHGISELERGARTKPRLSTVRLLADGLELDQRGAERLMAARNGVSAPRPISRLPHPTTSFVGRLQELGRIGTLLLNNDVRLVTLIGPGGVGKTRVALKLAHDLEAQFASGAVFVSLAEVTDVRIVLHTIAARLGVVPQPGVELIGTLAAALEQSQLLLVLDNLEHLIDCAPEIGRLLAECPQLTILATSRVRLRLGAEHVFRLAPLDIESDALTLFRARAAAADADFAPYANDDAEIVRKLEGLPLSIELAAAQVHHMSRATLLAQLDEQLPVLVDGAVDSHPRHRTLRDTIAWSYGLLSPAAQRALRWLGAFPAGCMPETAQKVLDSDIALHELVDFSLVHCRSAANGDPYYVMLQTVQEYALEMLQKLDEEETVRSTIHRVWAIPLSERASFRIWYPDAAEVFRMLDVEAPNLKAHMDWLIASEWIDDALLVSGRLTSWRLNGGRYDEARRELESLLYHPQKDPCTQGCVSAMTALGTVLTYLGESSSAVETLQKAALEASALGEHAYQANALMAQAAGLQMMGDLETAELRTLEGMAVAQTHGFIALVGFCLANLCGFATDRQMWDLALEYGQQSLKCQTESGSEWGLIAANSVLATLMLSLNHLAEAERYAVAAQAHMEHLGDRRDLSDVYRLLAEIAVQRGDRDESLSWLTAALDIAREIGSMSEMANVQLKLAAVDHAQASKHYTEAIHWFTRCGNTVGAQQARDGLDQLQMRTGEQLQR